MTTPSKHHLDPLIHEAARLRLMVLLNECTAADFHFLLRVTGLTRGNLSVHMSKLVTAGYVEERKEFVKRLPHTEYHLTSRGRSAFKHYLSAWEKLTRGRSATADPDSSRR